MICVIALDRATPTEHEEVQATVKRNATAWWHRFESLWLATGKSPREWRDLLEPILTSSQSSVLVLQLPSEPADRAWSYWGVETSDRMRWLHSNYDGQKSRTVSGMRRPQDDAT